MSGTMNPADTVKVEPARVDDGTRSVLERSTPGSGGPGRSAPLPDRTVREECGCRHPFGELATDGRESTLDVRNLSMHEQVAVTVQRAERLKTGEILRHVNTLVSWPLLAMLDTRGYRYRLAGREHGNTQILIWPLKGGVSVGPDSE